jgi:hypothetical protein
MVIVIPTNHVFLGWLEKSFMDMASGTLWPCGVLYLLIIVTLGLEVNKLAPYPKYPYPTNHAHFRGS